MRDYVGRTGTANYWEYRNHAEDLLRAFETLKELTVRCGASVAFFTALCVAWAVVFGVALR